MKLHQVTALVAALVCAGLLVGLGMRQRQLHDLRGEYAARAAELQVSEPAMAAQPSATPVEAPPSDAELRELLTLRRDVARLRQENPKLAVLQAENTRLRSAITNTLSGVNRVPVPEGYLVASQARPVGFATPSDALQSFLWAVRNRDTNVLFQSLTPASAEGVAGELARQGGNGFLGGFGALPGFLIKSVQENPAGTAFVELQIDPNDPTVTEKLPLERDAHGAWRLRLR